VNDNPVEARIEPTDRSDTRARADIGAGGMGRHGSGPTPQAAPAHQSPQVSR
jgi:hypothetical protein